VIPVLIVKGSLNQKYAIVVKTIVPIAKPINLGGHICPSKNATKYFTEYINRYDIGNPPTSATRNGCSLNQAHLNCPCSCVKVITCANAANNAPRKKFIY
jgi:hypothetical protein